MIEKDIALELQDIEEKNLLRKCGNGKIKTVCQR